MQKIWKQTTALCWAQICTSTGTLVQEYRNRNTCSGTQERRNTCSLPALALLHQFFPFQFVPSENNFRKASTKWWTLVLCNRNTSLTLNCQRIQCWDYIKRNTQTDAMTARGRGTSTYAPLKTQNWAYSGLENKRTTKYVYKYLQYF